MVKQGTCAGVPATWSLVQRSSLERRVLEVAPWLLGKLLWSRHADGLVTAGRIVEVEAYRQDDPASHSFRGVTPRTQVMFQQPGLLYVYFTYGMHWCCNVVVEEEGRGAAVLVRAIEPVLGVDTMFARREKARKPRDLGSGPAKAAQALGLDGEHNGIDLLSSSSNVKLLDDRREAPRRRRGERIGISKATHRPWRWWVADNENVSR